MHYFFGCISYVMAHKIELDKYRNIDDDLKNEVEIVPYLGNVSETMSSSVDSDDNELPKKKRIKMKRKTEKNGYDTDTSSSSVEVIDIKCGSQSDEKQDDNEISENPLGDSKVQELIFQNEMDLIDAEQKEVCIKRKFQKQHLLIK